MLLMKDGKEIQIIPSHRAIQCGAGKYMATKVFPMIVKSAWLIGLETAANTPQRINQMSDTAKCSICGEPMPKGEEMFNFHGYSGPCPKPPKSKIMSNVVVDYALRKERDGNWFVSITVDRGDPRSLGPFSDERSARAAYDDLLAMMRSVGAADVVPS